MEDYKEEYELGSIVTAKRTYNGEIITGEFGGFHLLDKSNPKSIVGVVHTPKGSYDVEPDSIESVISEDEKIKKILINIVKGACDDFGIKYKGIEITEEKLLAWLEKQGEQKPAFCHHEVDFSGCSEEYRKAYYDGWNNCNQQHDQLEAEQKPAWGEEDEKMWSTISDLLWEGFKLSDGKVSWDKIRCWLLPFKDRVQIQPKQEWSEEDEKIFRSLSKALARISSNTRTDSTSINYSFFIEIDWLKSLKERMEGE